jgi:ergothioneine biosynthesis protein EgtB
MLALIPSLEDEALDLLELGLNHEQQHQELLLTDIKFILGHNPLFPVYHDKFQETESGAHKDGHIEIGEGIFEVGYSGKGFHFDNEEKCHKVHLETFQIAKNLVTNEEYLGFIKDGGYQNAKYWHSDGWTWLKEHDVSHPLYWHFIDDEWRRYSLSGLETISANDPVTHISFYEASAFAEWAGMRLPTEFEWEVASDQFDWGQRWEHTNSAYLPYPGFLKPEGAIGEYNGKFMINQMVLRGSSIATPKGHSRKTYRNFFHPHLQWQFSGIRLCKK